MVKGKKGEREKSHNCEALTLLLKPMSSKNLTLSLS